MTPPVRFWGVALAIKPRLSLTKFDGETTAKGSGYLAVMEGTLTGTDGVRSSEQRFTVAFGPATRERRGLAMGDLLRGDAHPVPETLQDTPADLYRVGTLRTIARVGEPGGGHIPDPDPPRTDAPFTPDEAEAAPRRALHPDNLADDNRCALCPYGIIVPVVRLTDPRDYRSGRWSHVPACLGPVDCEYFAAYVKP
jgi:hypothetical protein